MKNDRLIPLSLILGLVVLIVVLSRPRERPPQQPGDFLISDSVASTPESRAEQLPVSYLTRIFYLFDISASMNDETLQCPFRRAVPLLARAIEAFANDQDLPCPQVHRVGTIEAVSLEEKPLCPDVLVSAPSLFGGSGSRARRAAEQTCAGALSNCHKTEYTDISGALKYAALAIKGKDKAARAIIIFSDLQENLARGQEAALADLRGICVAAYYSVTPPYTSKPNSYDADVLKAWRKRLDSRGAKSVMLAPMLAFNPQELTDFIRDCSRK